MHKAWRGDWPDRRAPSIQNIRLNNLGWRKDHVLLPHSEVAIDIDLEDWGGELRWQCALFPESTSKKTGGDRQQGLHEIPTTFSQSEEDGISFLAPEDPGAYRIFVTVCRDERACSTANIPFLVKR